MRSVRKVVSLLRLAVVFELTLWASLCRWILRRPLPIEPGGEPFSYAGVVKPILGVFIVLSAIEIPILDLILRHTMSWEPVRITALAIGIYGLFWMIGLLACMQVRPHVVGPSGFRIRYGAMGEITLPWEAVASVRARYRSLPTSRAVQFERIDDEVILNVGAAKQTSVDLLLRRPTSIPLPAGPSEPVTELRFYADDPDALVARVQNDLAVRRP